MTEVRRTRRWPRGTRLGQTATLLCVAFGGIPPADAAITIFLNDCRPVGCTVFGGSPDNSSQNRSSIVTGTRQLNPYEEGDEVWQQVVACVTEVWRPFNVTVVTADPAPAFHLEHMIAGHPLDLGFPDNTSGVSPAACSLVPNGISFTFSEKHGPDALALCWTASHEIGHLFGLDHEAYLPDPMTYLEGCGRKDFAASLAPCGEFTPRPTGCLCGGSTQDSYALLSERAGTNGFIFEGTFEDFEADWICDWSAQEPPPAGALDSAEAAWIDPQRPRCGTYEPENLQRSGFRAER